MKQIKISVLIRLLGLVALMGCWSMPSHAHLLNMTRITLQQGPSQNVTMTVVIDLTRATGSGENYYQLSQQPNPMSNPALLNIAQRIQQASVATINGNPINWDLTSASLPQDSPQKDFVSGLAWPMSTLVFNGYSAALETSNQDVAILNATFTSDFKFEEPIALSIQKANQQGSLNRWLVRNQQSPSFDLNAQAEAQQKETNYEVWVEYLWQGIIHILPKGWDHALFVLGLFLGARKVRDLILWITGFTMAHSITLGLAAYGAITISPVIIEPIIALSIAWIAIENISQSSSDTHKTSTLFRLIVVMIFGLVHGLGFAFVFKELGFPEQSLIGPLVSFNIGVEIAQLAIIAAAYVLLKRWYQGPKWRSLFVIPGSTIIAFIAISLMVLHLF